MSKKQDYSEIFAMYDKFQNPWQRHCLLVSLIATRIAQCISDRGEDINVELATMGGLVHDIGKATTRSQKDPRYHCVDGYLILEKMGYDELKMFPLTHSFPDLSNISLVPGYYNELWDPDVRDKTNTRETGLWDTFIPDKLREYKQTIYDIIVNLADLMAAGNRPVTIEQRLDYVKGKYGDSPKDFLTEQAIQRNVVLIEKQMGKKLTDLKFD